MAAVAETARQLAPDVVKIITELGDDWTDEPSAFFMVILADASTEHENLLKNAHKVQDTIERDVQPHEWGVHPYFRFRSQSEQAAIDQRGAA